MSSWHAVRKSPKCWKGTSAMFSHWTAHITKLHWAVYNLNKGILLFWSSWMLHLFKKRCLSGPFWSSKSLQAESMLKLSGSLFIRVPNSSIPSFHFSASFCRLPFFSLPFVFSLAALLGPLLLNIGFEIYGFGFLSFWLPFVFSILRLPFVDFRPFGCLLSSLWLPCWACCSLCSPLSIGFEIYGFGFLSFWLPFASLSAAFCRFPSFWLAFVFSLAAFLGLLLPPQSLKYWFWNLWFWISGLLAAFCLLFRLLFVDFCPFGCLLSSPWLPCWARCSLRSPLNIGFEIYGFGFPFFWLAFVFSGIMTLQSNLTLEKKLSRWHRHKKSQIASTTTSGTCDQDKRPCQHEFITKHGWNSSQ